MVLTIGDRYRWKANGNDYEGILLNMGPAVALLYGSRRGSYTATSKVHNVAPDNLQAVAKKTTAAIVPPCEPCCDDESSPVPIIQEFVAHGPDLVRIVRPNGVWERYPADAWLKILDRSRELERLTQEQQQKIGHFESRARQHETEVVNWKAMVEKSEAEVRKLREATIEHYAEGCIRVHAPEGGDLVRIRQRDGNVAEYTATAWASFLDENVDKELELDGLRDNLQQSHRAVLSVVSSGRVIPNTTGNPMPLEYNIPADVYRNCVAIHARAHGVQASNVVQPPEASDVPPDF